MYLNGLGALGCLGYSCANAHLFFQPSSFHSSDEVSFEGKTPCRSWSPGETRPQSGTEESGNAETLESGRTRAHDRRQLHTREGKSPTHFSMTFSPERLSRLSRTNLITRFLPLPHPLEERRLEFRLPLHMRDLLFVSAAGLRFSSQLSISPARPSNRLL